MPIQNERLTISAAALLFLLPFSYAIISRMKLYCGWRHLYFIYPGMLIVSAYGIVHTGELLRSKRLIMLYNLSFTAVLTCFAVMLLLNNPFQTAYYNPLAGNGLDRFGFQFYEVCVRTPLEFIADQAPEGSAVTVSTVNNSEKLAQHIRKAVDTFVPDRVACLSEPGGEYLIELSTSADKDVPEMFLQDGYKMIKEFTAYGNSLYRVYKKDSSDSDI